MELKGILDAARQETRPIYVTIWTGDLEVPFVLPSIREARRYQFLLEKITDSFSQSIIYEQIFTSCCLDKELLKADIPAGISESTARLVMWLSGFGEEPVEYLQAQFEANRVNTSDTSIVWAMKRTICSAFKAYTFADLDELDYSTLVEIFIQAEKVLLDAGIIKEEYKLKKPKDNSTQVKVEDLIKQDRKDLSQLNAPLPPQRLQRGERPPPTKRRR